MKIRYLLDEHLSLRLKAALKRRDLAVDILRVGDEGAPPLGTLDPDILRYLEQSGRALITKNRASMEAHTKAHLSSGGHFNGVFRVRPKTPPGRLIDELYLLWAASEASEWKDQLPWLPL